MPRPRLHLIRFHGVLAPNAKLRGKIVPAPAECATETSSEDAHAQGVSRIEVSANPHALGFYEKAGFEVEGQVETEFGSGLRMYLELV